MLSVELNEKLSRVGPGTPMGKLMRCYWHPIAAAAELNGEPVKRVRILGEDLVLYKDLSGNLGLIDAACPHRGTSLEYGIPEPEGLRCAYHGWLWNRRGRCLEQPAEPTGSTYKDRVEIKAYPVQELGGLVFAYLGPEPVPLLPRYDLFVWDNVWRQIGATVLPCNWLQCMENSLDPVHVEWLHGYYFAYAMRRRGETGRTPFFRKHVKIGFDRFEHGIIKRRILEGESEENDVWKVGHPIVFPTMLRVGNGGAYFFNVRVPMDDTHTWHVVYSVYRPGISVSQEDVPFYDIPLKDEQGKFIVDFVQGQDYMAWASQGPIAPRHREHLAQSDIGVIMYRELLQEQLARVERGEDPMEVYRDPTENQCIALPQEEFGLFNARFSVEGQRAVGRQDLLNGPYWDRVVELFREAERRAAAGEPLLSPIVPPLFPIDAEHHREVLLVRDPSSP